MGVMPAIVGALSVGVAFLLLRKRGVAERPAIWITTGFATSTLLWVAGTGGTHHMAQVSATLFLLLTLWFALDRRRPYLAGFLFSLAVGSRLPVGAAVAVRLSVPARHVEVPRRGRPRRGAARAVQPGALRVDDGLRIRPDPVEQPSNGLVTGEPWFKDGIESPTYIPQGLHAMLWSWPTIDASQAPFVRPSLQLDSLLLAAPFLFWSLLARGRDALAIGIAAILVITVDLMHGSVGFAQFGDREFILDATPLLLVLIGMAIPNRTPFLFKIAVIVGAVATGYALWALGADFTA